jgi:prepilin-type N-terminal cleavage/methylation domain-containing protein
MNRRGFSMIEVTISALVLGLMMTAALNAVGLSAKIRSGQTSKSMAMLLCTDLLSEISSHPFPDTLGPVPATMTPIQRSQINDVLDYAQWSEQPPLDINGTPIPGATNWTRTIELQWVNPLAPNSMVVNASGLLRITVRVERNGILLAQATTLRSVGGDHARWGQP